VPSFGTLKALVILLDGVAFALALWITVIVFGQLHPELVAELQLKWHELWGINRLMPPGILLLLTWLAAMRHYGLYNPSRMTNSPRIAAGVTRAALLVPIVSILFQFFFIRWEYSRDLVLLLSSISYITVLALRLVFFRFQRHIPKPISRQRVAIVGTSGGALAVSERLQRHVSHAYSLMGFISTQGEIDDTLVVPADQVLGEISMIRTLVNEQNIHVLILATQQIPRGEALVLATEADQMGLRVLQVPFNWGMVATPRVQVDTLGDFQLVDLTTLAYPTLATQTKRTLDLLLVGFGMLLLLPLLTIVALLIRLQDGGPIFFIQPRAGRGGRRFPFYKFRSMVIGAEAQRAELQALNETDGVLFKIKNDPRITPLGSFIRKYSIDEFPQLWNVLRGDMNLVGPRPLPMSDLAGMEEDPEVQYWYELRSKVKPGITGPWQVSGRSDLGFREMVQHDINYIQNWSLWLDILVLIKTIPAVLRGRGAK
jgi:exopolysaccharide biosynthesis polyprenyl glycosylphosphotransferase